MTKNNPILVSDKAMELMPYLIINLPSGRIEFEDNAEKLAQFLEKRCDSYWNHEILLQDVFNNSSSFHAAALDAYRSFILEGSVRYFGVFDLGETTSCNVQVFISIQAMETRSVAGLSRFKCTFLGFADQVTVSQDYRRTISSRVRQQLETDITHREIQVLSRIANGFTVKEIAEELFISAHTVESHKQKLYKKFDVRNTAQLGKLAERYGLTTE